MYESDWPLATGSGPSHSYWVNTYMVYEHLTELMAIIWSANHLFVVELLYLIHHENR